MDSGPNADSAPSVTTIAVRRLPVSSGPADVLSFN
jgi:hypothetical protein